MNDWNENTVKVTKSLNNPWTTQRTLKPLDRILRLGDECFVVHGECEQFRISNIHLLEWNTSQTSLLEGSPILGSGKSWRAILANQTNLVVWVIILNEHSVPKVKPQAYTVRWKFGFKIVFQPCVQWSEGCRKKRPSSSSGSMMDVLGQQKSRAKTNHFFTQELPEIASTIP